MEEPVARSSCAQQRHIQRTESGAGASSGYERQRYDSSFAWIPCCPAACARRSGEKRSGQPDRGGACLCRAGCGFEIAPGVAKKVGGFVFRIARDASGLFGGFADYFTGLFFYSRFLEHVIGGFADTTRAFRD